MVFVCICFSSKPIRLFLLTRLKCFYITKNDSFCKFESPVCLPVCYTHTHTYTDLTLVWSQRAIQFTFVHNVASSYYLFRSFLRALLTFCNQGHEDKKQVHKQKLEQLADVFLNRSSRISSTVRPPLAVQQSPPVYLDDVGIGRVLENFPL